MSSRAMKSSWWMPDIPKSAVLRRRMFWAYVFVAAPVVALLVFLAGPILFSGWVSLHRWDMLSPVGDMPWRGLQNYVFLLTRDTIFIKALGNTFLFAIGGVGANTILGLGFALLLNSRIRGRTVWRVLYFMPVITAPLALAVMFSFIFDRNYGVVNNVITALGLPRQPFLSGPHQALMTLIFIAIYQYVGYYIVIFLAGLQGIPQDYYDAAQVDGAGNWQAFRFVTLPLLRPVMLFVVVTNTIGALQVFDLVFATTGGAPANSSMTVVLHMYNTAFKFSRMGRASAMAFILFAIIMLITVMQVRLLRDRAYQD
ncbi:MAG: sugar ABC transporter permease [Chloroflexota bacterium]|nr:sugar ABC transporter permease [Chloroflexota bacterium]